MVGTAAWYHEPRPAGIEGRGTGRGGIAGRDRRGTAPLDDEPIRAFDGVGGRRYTGRMNRTGLTGGLLAAALATAHAGLPEPLYRYRAGAASIASNHWIGTPGPAARLPSTTSADPDAVIFSGRGAGVLLSRDLDARTLRLPAEALTVEAVVSVESPRKWGGVLGFLQDNGPNEKGWILGYDESHFYIGLSAAGADDGDGRITYLAGRTAWERGRFHHVAATYDGRRMALYVNGRLDAESSEPHGPVLYPDHAVFTLGAYRDDDECHPLAGRVAFAAVYGAAAGEEEIAALYAPWRDAVAAAPRMAAASVPAAPGVAGARPAPDGRVRLPVHQILSPAGRQVVLPGVRPLAVAFAPGGAYLVTSGRKPELILVDPASGAVLRTVAMPSERTTAPPRPADHILASDKGAEISFTGLVFSPAGDRIYLSNVDGDLKVFAAGPKPEDVRPLFSIPLPKRSGLKRAEEIPAGLAVSPDGRRLYVALNLGNQAAEIDAQSGAVLRAWDTGVAPFDVALGSGKLYVSCQGGRRPGAGDPTGPAGRGTVVRVDPLTHVAAEGSVCVIDLARGAVEAEILTGRHAAGLALSPDGRRLAVANANSDTVSLLDPEARRVVETFSANGLPSPAFGASPNALAFAPDGRTLYVANGTQNAVAVIEVRPGGSRLAGLVPVGWFPGAVALAPDRPVLAVANVKGIGSSGQAILDGKEKFNSHEHCGSLSLVPLPSAAELAAHTRTALANGRREVLEAASLPARSGQPPRAVPERPGEPSPIRHVIYAIKENRTYDQVLGDVEAGDGDPSLCIYGERVTPNQHKLVREFVLLDNTHCCGVLSADGHQWCTTGLVTDYLEKQFAGFPRSYPDLCGPEEHDALAYSPAGFLWDAAFRAGRTVRNFGESSGPSEVRWRDGRRGRPRWSDLVADWSNRTGLVELRVEAGVPSLRGHSCTHTVGWELGVPDVVRVERFLDEFRVWEREGAMPDLVIMVLPMDHTAGTKPGIPTPEATVADNDLAVGRLVEAVSRSRFWKDTVLFLIEDDPQNGWDHVSPYRTTAYLAGAHVRRGAVVSEFYSQNSVLRTIELILGLPPMNQLDAIAPPMTACFQDTPDLRPFESVPNRVALDSLNPAVSSIRDPVLRRDARRSERLPLARVDACPEDVFNGILWRAARGSSVPYPGWAVLAEPGREEEEEEAGGLLLHTRLLGPRL